MDTTVISDVDLLPAEMDIEESSFLKNNSFLAPKLDTSADPQASAIQRADEEQLKRIKELEILVEEQKT